MAMGTSVFAVFDSIVRNTEYDPHHLSDLIYQLVSNAATAQPSVVDEKRKSSNKERAKLRKAQITESAMQIFSSKGFMNATISEIADHAQLGDATLYEYFDNKEAILLSIPETYLQAVATAEDFILQDDVPGTEKILRKLLWRWMWLLYPNERFSRLFVLEHLRNIHFYSSPAYVHFEAFLGNIRATVEKGQKEGIFSRDIPFPTYQHMIIGTVDQFLLPHLLMNRPPSGIAELTDIVDSLVRAIKVNT